MIKNWKYDRIKDVAKINPPQPVIANDELVSVIPMECVSEKGHVGSYENKEYRDVDKGLNYFEAGDVLFAKITPCMENGKGAFVQKLNSKYAFGSTEFFVLRPSGLVDGKFLYYLTYQEGFRKYAEANMKGAAGQQRVPSKILAYAVVPLPPKPEQTAIAAHLDRVCARIDAVIALNSGR